MTCCARNGFSPSAAKNACMPSRSRLSRWVGVETVMGISTRAQTNVPVAEEIRDLVLCGLTAVGAVHRVFLDVGGEVGANRAGSGLLRIGRAHNLAMAHDRVLAFEDLHHHRTRGHELDQVAEELPLFVYGVDAFGLLLIEMQHLGRD